MSPIENIDKLITKFNNLGEIEEILSKSMGQQVQMIRGDAVRLCPVDKGELRGSILGRVDKQEGKILGTVYTNKSYAAYVEFGTGPKGQEDHKGISPNVDIAYSQKGWSYMGEEGEFIYTNGQAAQPFLYPALKQNEQKVLQGIASELKAEIKRRGT